MNVRSDSPNGSSVRRLARAEDGTYSKVAMLKRALRRVVAIGSFAACGLWALPAAAAPLASPSAPPTAMPTMNAALAAVVTQPSAIPVARSGPSPTPAPGPARRQMDAPLDPTFPSNDFPAPAYLIGTPSDTGNRAYGWIDAGLEATTSAHSNYPLSYNDVPNSPQLDQAVLRFERQPDTMSTTKFDWGYRLTSVYGADYRYTTMEGVLSNQLLLRNQTNGFDPVEMYAVGYDPYIGKGTTVQLGRFISPPDIEANLAPQNFLYTHSVMFTFDCYTQMGV